MNPLSSVTGWLYHLGPANAARRAEIGASDAGLVVVDYARGNQVPYKPAEVAAMRGANDKLVVSYLSIGEAEQYRSYWRPSWNDDPPGFIADPNPEWTDNFKVAYWKPAWKQIVFDYVDAIIEGGFNGVYLDIIDAYDYWEDRDPGRGGFYKTAMVDLVGEIRAHANDRLARRGDDRDFVIIGQNGEDLANRPAYLRAVDGIGKEDLYFYYPNGEPETFGPVPKGWLTGSKALLRTAEAAGVEVFVVEYVPPPDAAGAAGRLAREIAYLREQGVPLYVAEERDLRDIYDGYPTDGAAGRRIVGTGRVDEIDGGRGDDRIVGRGGDDVIRGGAGDDRLHGGAGDDRVGGGAGGDRLVGGAGDDDLFGRRGGDTFVFRGDWGWDVVADFVVGADRLAVLGARQRDAYETPEGLVVEFDTGSAIELRNVGIESLDLIL